MMAPSIIRVTYSNDHWPRFYASSEALDLQQLYIGTLLKVSLWHICTSLNLLYCTYWQTEDGVIYFLKFRCIHTALYMHNDCNCSADNDFELNMLTFCLYVNAYYVCYVKYNRDKFQLLFFLACFYCRMIDLKIQLNPPKLQNIVNAERRR